MARYVISLPERVVRSAAALAGGLIREIGDVSVASAVRRTKTYQMMVDIALRFMIEQVGEVKGVYPSGGELANDFLLRRTAGHGIELAGLLAFRASPVWIMAALADVSGAGRHIVQEIADALKQEGLLAGDARFENVDQLLEGLEQTASQVADLCNAPPLDVAGLRREWSAFREAVAKIPPRNLPSVGFLGEHWEELKAEAAAQNRPVFELSSMMAVSAIARVPVTLLKTGARLQSRGLAIRTDAGRKRPAPLQPGFGRHSRAGLRGVLGAGVSALSARGCRAVFTQAPVADGAVAQEGDSVDQYTGVE